ncbi:Interferon-induced very large GTPase 1 [Holothuria leucospilota]|uniref:Interferon-induced very large GTPase 1 n=1 Tax=Holothuria leucospilota TaxID=206669 RepID=A0A9Q0YJS5_HOLLE|nr:Interferon-induced very large GTPase 1 [Holothuria leucospilota]
MLRADGESLKFERLLELISLKDKFPGKMGLKGFVKVKRACSMEREAHMVELFWQKRSSLDYRVRSDRFLRSNGLQKLSIRDFIFAVMQCSDRCLRQDIVEKMSACHLAVPVLLPGVHERKSEFLLWSLRRVVKIKWKESNSLALEQHIVQVPFMFEPYIKNNYLANITNCYKGPETIET